MKYVVIGEAFARRLKDAVAWVETQRTLQASRGTFRVAPQYDDTVGFVNNSGLEIPAYGVVWLDDYEADYVMRDGKRPALDGEPSIGIATATIPAGGTGRAWIDGIHPVLTSDVIGTLSFPVNAIAESNAFTARAYAGGPLRFLGAASVPAFPGANLVMAEVTHMPIGSRGDILWHDGVTWRPFTKPVVDSGLKYDISDDAPVWIPTVDCDGAPTGGTTTEGATTTA